MKKELDKINPANLHKRLIDVWSDLSEKSELPDPEEIKNWIEQAKLLEPMLSY